MNTANYADTLEVRGQLARQNLLRRAETPLTGQVIIVEDEHHKISPHNFLWGMPNKVAKHILDNALVPNVIHGVVPNNFLGLSGVGHGFEVLDPSGAVVPFHVQNVRRAFIGLTGALTSINQTWGDVQVIEGSLSPFQELHAIRSDDSLYKEEIADISKSETLPYAKKLSERLNLLLEYFKEDYDGRSLSSNSLKGLKQFLFSNQVLLPSVTAIPNGDIYAQWKNKDKSNLLSVHFFSDFSVRFFIIKPNKKHNKLDNLSGQTTVDSLTEYLTNYEVFDWIKA